MHAASEWNRDWLPVCAETLPGIRNECTDVQKVV